jgi:hypothetical protein
MAYWLINSSRIDKWDEFFIHDPKVNVRNLQLAAPWKIRKMNGIRSFGKFVIKMLMSNKATSIGERR